MALTFRCVDEMKATRDSGSWSNADKVSYINRLVELIPDLTHIAVASYPDNPGYHSVAYVKEWFDIIHDAGKKVFFRPALTGATTSGTNEEKIAQFQTIVTTLSTCWAVSGDAWDVWPEVGSSAFGGLAAHNQWIQDVIPALQSSFAGIGKDVDCTFFSMTDGYWVFNQWIDAATVAAMGNKLCVDFYPMDYIGSPGQGTTDQKTNNFIGQLENGHENYPDADIYITETGYNATSTVTDADQLDVLTSLFNKIKLLDYVKGFSYWVGYGRSYDTTRLFATDSITTPRLGLQAVEDYFAWGAAQEAEEEEPPVEPPVDGEIVYNGSGGSPIGLLLSLTYASGGESSTPVRYGTQWTEDTGGGTQWTERPFI